MRTLHLDNAKEFHGLMLERACAQYGIEISYRPVKTPRYGGHIERLLGTVATEIHTLPGTTFSNPKARGEYDSEGRAALTLSDFERWLTTFIVQVYHARVHSGLGVPPAERYKQGVLADTSDGRGRMPLKIVDEERLRLDFMPFEERTIQDYGVMIDGVTYSHAVLRPWVGARNPKDETRKRLFVFRRDPRDISVVWFYDPELQTYFPIPYRDTSRPPISLWELREARRTLTQTGKKFVDESAIFAAYERLRDIETQAQLKTKAARRAVQRRVSSDDRTAREIRASRVAPEPLLPADIEPFDELEDL
jgi:putative transposase